jgi:hypothetical protein
VGAVGRILGTKKKAIGMNERIRELVKQAGGHFSTHNLMSNPVQHRESIELWDKNIEKFAELIVRECAEWLRQPVNQTPSSREVMNIAAARLKQHFGVEE